ncbi:2-dehydro-3-deoxy-D-arabinonate dehydratase [Pontibacter ummariensis]|uniref:2-dehydro-3-deoxy-D-arabinonate dehydratase n=1 Tax=Pontibacter ummariensis TaxID=1610492 RepID=A0A239B8X9_9BACT|nr:fumarylacetoacetate hydrolase family protein [Pontibacter ummariensis]PRY16362.1 2-dehydro-3-deoxy-D-arabinonate dehydratase [Pontibacter ummariensis]SNS03838.1 2-dehydro-3-deoxy-D-arabinonate dehydratase [Pontibacter ummariensis]
MKLYRTQQGLVIEKEESLYPVKEQPWDEFVNDDQLYGKMLELTQNQAPDPEAREWLRHQLLAPVQSQEIWASGVTYYRSKVGRQEESKGSGGGEFYALVYEAERPELFFKATAYRTVGPGGKVSIRKDSTWDVPEPELTLVLTSSGKIVGYTIGNDMSSRSIEGENPLYLPQAKTYDGSAAVGPCILVTEKPLPKDTLIQMEIRREEATVFEGCVELAQMKRKPEELASFLYRECSFPSGSLLMTGTGIVPENEFTLQQGDEIRITIEPIGTLVNYVK